MQDRSATGTRQLEAAVVLDALPSPALLVDLGLEILAVNDAAAELLGRDAVDLLGCPLLSQLADVDPMAAQGTARATREGSAWELSGTAGPPGARRKVRLRAGALRSPSGGAGAVVALAAAELPAAAPGRTLVDELAEALQRDAVVVHYQPIVRLHDRRPVGAEALVRWEHPQRGLLLPAEFLPAVDSPALVASLGQRVLRQACHAATSWSREVAGGASVQVAVNLSERELLQPGTVTFVREALAVAECAAERLLLEVPEQALLREPDEAGRALAALKDLGVQLAVDDLGTGSSPLSYLKRFPVDVVKVDRSLVAGLGHDADQSAVVASLISMARAIGVRCVAEGVETADQLSVLRRLGCDLGQGYLFSRPLPAHAAVQWLSRATTPRPARPRSAPALQTAVVERALQLQAEGASLHTIAARLNAEGHRNTGARRWHHTSVAQVIAAHLYPDLTR